MVRAADPFVRVLVRRPHAYFFLGEYLAPDGSGMSGAVDGVTLDGGRRLPIPGVYVLDAAGEPLASVSLLAAEGRERLLEALGAPADAPDGTARDADEGSDR